MNPERWTIWIDRGGTFTDCIGVAPGSGEIKIEKLLSSDAAPLAGIRKLMGLSEDEAIPPCDLRMGTTVATNALLERRGVPCALLITAGLGDLLEIGDQRRPELFSLEIERAPPLHSWTLEIDARHGNDGTELLPLDERTTRQRLFELHASGVRSVAVVLLHGHRHPAHERALGPCRTRHSKL